MRPQPITLHLGGEHWQVRPLTLGQIQRIEPLLSPEDAARRQSRGRHGNCRCRALA